MGRSERRTGGGNMASLQGISQGLRFVREYHSMPISQLEVLLLLKKEYPKPMTFADIGEALGMSQPTTSKNCRKLGTLMTKEKGVTVDKGYNLVDIGFDPFDTRSKTAKLNKNGDKMISTFLSLVGTD
jgi:DNA-binding MarR family transcriptional regulator